MKRSDLRSDIQGLRAIAVLLVIASHIPLTTKLPGGYVGVDIFFVISGYVIALALTRATERYGSGVAMYRNFMRDRIYRLVPALYVMIAVVCLLAIVFALSNRLTQITGSAVSSAFFISNFWYLTQFDSYWNPEILLDPLLHTWSLGIEFQTYLVLPLFFLGGSLLAVSKQRRLVARWIVLLAFAAMSAGLFTWWVSLSATSIQYEDYQAYAFYLPITRFWEFALGLLAAWVTLSVKPLVQVAHRIIKTLAIGTLLVGLYWANVAGELSLALVPITIAVAVLLVLGSAPDQSDLILGSRPMVWIGDRSYSIYLWHWPLFTLVLWLFADSPLAALLAMVASFVLADLSYRYVENSLRRRSSKTQSGRRRSMTTIVLVTSASVVITALAGLWFPRNSTQELSRLATTAIDPGVSYDEMMWGLAGCSVESDSKVIDCNNFPEPGAPRVVVIGDSISYLTFHAIAYLARERGMNASLRVAGCSIEKDSCESGVYEYLASERPAAVFVVGNYSRPSNVLNDWEAKQGLVPICPQDSPLELCAEHQAAVDEFRTAGTAGVKQLSDFTDVVIVASPFPQQPLVASECAQQSLFERTIVRSKSDACSGVPLQWQIDRQGGFLPAFTELGASDPSVEIWNPLDAACWNDFCPTTVNDGELFMIDGIHLTIPATRFLIPSLTGPMDRIALLSGLGWRS